jgi:putative endonuclease
VHRKNSLSGAAAEQLALNYLQEQGLKLLAKNFRTPRGEIDLIMRDNTHLVFVEVRFRQSSALGSAEESITQQKCQRLTAAALAYMQKQKLTNKLSARFDAVAISPASPMALQAQTGYRINWVKNILQ